MYQPRRAVIALAVAAAMSACSQRSSPAAPAPSPALVTCQDAQKLADLHAARGAVPSARIENPTAADNARYDQLTTLINAAAVNLEAVAATDSDPDLRDMARVVAVEDLQGPRGRVQPNWITDVEALPGKCSAIGYTLDGFDIVNLAG